MAITYLTFAQLLSNLIQQWAADVGVQPNLVSGDPVLALLDCGANQGILLENFLQAVQLMARLSTASGDDCDTFVADFGLTRLPATQATGAVTITATGTPTTPVVIPLGTVVQTQGGAVQYQLVADTTQQAYDPVQGAYVIPAGQTSITATVEALDAGSAQNVQIGQLVQFGTAVGGVSAVTNLAPITNGLDAETDSALRARFVQFFASLSKATLGAIQFAINSVQQGLNFVVLENLNPQLVPENGYFTVVVSAGATGTPASLITAIQAAVDAIRAFTIQFAVIAPTLVTANIVVKIRSSAVLAGSDETAAQNAIVAMVNSLKIGQSLTLASIASTALNASPTITDVQLSTITINGVAADLMVTQIQEIETTTANVTVSLY